VHNAKNYYTPDDDPAEQIRNITGRKPPKRQMDPGNMRPGHVEEAPQLKYARDKYNIKDKDRKKFHDAMEELKEETGRLSLEGPEVIKVAKDL
jgi:hypothetical protein